MALPKSDPGYAAESLGQYLNTSNWILTGISLAFLVLRVYCKAMHSRGLWWDDHFLVASWIALALSSGFNVASVRDGFGHHVSTLSEAQLKATSLHYAIASTFLITASAWSKTSFAITLLRITDRKLKFLIWFIIISMNLTKAGSAMVAWISCQPIQRSWDPTIKQGSCWPKMPVAYYNLFSGVYSGAADLVLALLPWKVIMALQMKTREKVGVAVAMSMGIFAAITAFIKCAKIPTLFGGDFTYEGTALIVWGSAETATTIMAASIPVLRVLFRDVRASATERRYHGPSAAYHLPASRRQHQPDHLTSVQSTTVTVTAGRSPNTPGYFEGSEKGFLNDSTGTFELGHPGGRIVQTNEVTIDYHDRMDEISLDKFDQEPRRTKM